MTWSIHLATRYGNENSSMMLKKKMLIIIHNKVKSEKWITVTSAKRAAVFQASLKVVREEASAQFSNKDKIIQHPKDHNIYEKKDAVNKNDTLT